MYLYQVDCDRGALVKNTLIGGVESALLDLDMASWQVSSCLTVPYLRAHRQTIRS